MSARLDGDPVVDAQSRKGTSVDDALEEFAGWCRGCHHQVRADAGGRRVCAECGLDAAPVLEDARRLREHPRAATWLAWSMIAFGAALWMRAYGGLGYFLGVVHDILNVWWPAAAGWLFGPGPAVWLVDLCTYGIWLTANFVVPFVVVAALTGVVLSLRAARMLDRKMLVLAVMAIAGMTLEYGESFGWWTMELDLDPRGWSARSRAVIARQVIFELVQFAGPIVSLVACVLVLTGRGPTRLPRLLVHVIVAMTAIVILDVVASIGMSVVSTVESITFGEGVGLITPAVMDISREIQQSGRLYWTRELITMSAATTVLALLGWLLCCAGHSVARLRTGGRDAPEIAVRLQRRRRHFATWITAVFIVTAVMTGVALPLSLYFVDQSWSISRLLIAALGIPSMLPVIGGAVRGSWRFALVLIVVSIIAAVLSGAAAIAIRG